jgi:hypothetical protein
MGDRKVAVRDVIERAIAHRIADGGGAPSSKTEFVYPEFREALLAVAGESGAINSKRLGNFVAKSKGRIIGGKRLVREGDIGGSARWRLEIIAVLSERDAV